MKPRDVIQFVTNPSAWREWWELSRIEGLPRYTTGFTSLFGPPFEFVDSSSFLFIHDELFRKHAYDFAADTESPRIIDGGANIGLSVLYFKRRYPEARVVAFEADPEIFAVLSRNAKSMAWSHVTLRNEALWSERSEVAFAPEQADGGRIDSQKGTLKVSAVPLGEMLDQPVDLLKLDIEGAEWTVLEAARAQLNQVRKLFVEYHSFESRAQELGDLLRLLTESGFRYYLTAPSVFSPRPLVQSESYHGCDMVLNIYALRD